MRQNARALVQAAVLAALLISLLPACSDSPTASGGIQTVTVSALAPRDNETLDANKNDGLTTIRVLASGPSLDNGKMTQMWVSLSGSAPTGGAGNDGERYVIFSISVPQGTPQDVVYNLNGFMRPDDTRLYYGRIRVSTTEELNHRPDGSNKVYTVSVNFVRAL